MSVRSEWLLCPSARDEAKRTGLVCRCDGRINHICDGPREPYKWKAYVEGESFESGNPCCSSCMTDQEFGYDEMETFRCCCVHQNEHDERSRGKEDGNA